MAMMWEGNGRVYHVRDILREFLGRNFVSGLRTLKTKKLKKTKKNFFSKKSRFFQPWFTHSNYVAWALRKSVDLFGLFAKAKSS